VKSATVNKKPASIKRLTSAGGVIFRKNDDGIDIALVAVNPVKRLLSAGVKSRWCLPKGIIDKNESEEMTAVREVREETGLSGEIIGKIGSISYWYFLTDENARLNKTVHFYLMKYASGNTADHDHEVDDAQWFPADEALEKLTYKGEREILQKAKKLIEKEIAVGVIK
jgi:8-oxo-dGTP pyrophosphatase MutT (NUDIX family)